MQKKKIKVCKNHLTQLFEALKTGDLNVAQKIEHELSPTEECIACTYLLKADVKTNDVMRNALRSHGYNVPDVEAGGFSVNMLFWTLRLMLLSATFLLTLIVEALVKWVFFDKVNFYPKNPIEWIAIGIFSLFIFLFSDDLLFD